MIDFLQFTVPKYRRILVDLTHRPGEKKERYVEVTNIRAILLEVLGWYLGWNGLFLFAFVFSSVPPQNNTDLEERNLFYKISTVSSSFSERGLKRKSRALLPSSLTDP